MSFVAGSGNQVIASLVVTKARYVSNGEGQPFSYWGNSDQPFNYYYYRDDVPNWSRTWDNASTLRGASGKLDKSQWPWKEVVVILPRGPKLSYKITLPNGKLVWARRPIQVYVWKRVPPQKKPKSKRKVPLMTPPNALDFYRRDVSYHSSTGITVDQHTPWGIYRDVVSGPLWTEFSILGQTVATRAGFDLNRPFIDSDQINTLRAKAGEKALNKFLTKVKDEKVNLAQDLAERAQTVKMFSSLAGRLAKALLALKKGQLAKASGLLLPNTPKGVSSDWLMYQYGVKPLISSINGLMEHLTSGKPLTFDITAKHTEKFGPEKIWENGSINGFSSTAEAFHTCEVTVKYKTRVTVNSTMLRDFAQLGFSNPLNLAWELVPYSFVADWFIPIGAHLSNLDAYQGLSVSWTTKTTFIKSEIVYERQFGGTSGGVVTSSGSAGSRTRQIYCQRSLIAPPDVGLPSFKDPVSVLHIANAIALLIQLKK